MNKPQAMLEKFQRDIDYGEAHREELLGQYPEQWVAILDQQVVGDSADPYQLIADLRAKAISTERVLLRHLTHRPELTFSNSLRSTGARPAHNARIPWHPPERLPILGVDSPNMTHELACL